MRLAERDHVRHVADAPSGVGGAQARVEGFVAWGGVSSVSLEGPIQEEKSAGLEMAARTRE